MVKWLGRLLCLCSFLIFPARAAAAGEFFSRFLTTYSVSSAGVTTVSHQIELTNRLRQVYAKEYTITIGSTRVKNVTAHSPNGPVATQVKISGNTTSIKLDFQNPVVGKDQTLKFTVDYLNLDIAAKNGRVLEVNIPRLGGLDAIDDYTLVVKVPDIFDNPTIISPATSSIFADNGQKILRWSKDQLAGGGVSILFGDHQVYDFTLRYSLHNSLSTPTVTYVAIPPDTPFQKLYYQTLQPQPENIDVDPDGNWLAKYPLKQGETLQVTASGQAVLYLTPTVNLPAPLTSAKHLEADKYWPVTDPAVKTLGQRLANPANIYNYLVNNFAYNYNRVDASSVRLGAKAALEDPNNAICTEFTDLFISLARAAGIPARGVDGFAFTANSTLRPLSLRLDILHAWPEYYDSARKIWIPVDPTWGNTTQGIDYFSRWDLNHFAFVIHGVDSETPYPAGAYKLASTSGKDVHVAFSLDEPRPSGALAVFSVRSPAFWPPALSVSLVNRSNHSTTINQLSADLDGYNVPVDKPPALGLIPPFASRKFTIKLPRRRLSAYPDSLKLNLNGRIYALEIPAAPFKPAALAYAVAAVVLAAGLVVTALYARRLLIHNSLSPTSLHRQSQKSQK